MIRTDLMVHFTLQRSFPWARVALFADQIPVKCAVFLSEKDCLVASDKVRAYWDKKGAFMSTSENYEKRERSEAGKLFLASGGGEGKGGGGGRNDVFLTTFLGCDHGDFLADGKALDAVVRRLEQLEKDDK